jgi:hypothetical protein
MNWLNDLIPDRLSRLVATLGVLTYLIGTIFAVAELNPHTFQRFGSIGVAAAILFFTDRLMQVELRRQKTVERILHEYGLELEVLKEGVDPRELPKTGYMIDYLREEQKFSILRHHAERINSLNIFLLTAATLQWGFGDVFLRWLIP